jgi:hypothetical protein
MMYYSHKSDLLVEVYVAVLQHHIYPDDVLMDVKMTITQ